MNLSIANPSYFHQSILDLDQFTSTIVSDGLSSGGISGSSIGSSSSNSISSTNDGDGKNFIPNIDSAVSSHEITSSSASDAGEFIVSPTYNGKASLIMRLLQRFALIFDNCLIYLQNQFNEHTATSIASISVVIIVISIIFCTIVCWAREEERKIKENYKKLNRGSSQSYIGILDANRKILGSNSRASNEPESLIHQHLNYNTGPTYRGHRNSNINKSSHSYHALDRPESASHNVTGSRGGGAASSCSSSYNQTFASISPSLKYSVMSNFNEGTCSTLPANSSYINRSESHKLHVIELRRETYFGLVRLLKPGCHTIVLLCNSQSKSKLLNKFYRCIYPYRKNKTLLFAYMLIEKNISWYEGLLKSALYEKRDLNINPINCIGTVLSLNGFKKYFSVYHASDIRCDPDDHLILLEETLLDGLPYWLERLIAGKVNRYYVKYWPERMR